MCGGNWGLGEGVRGVGVRGVGAGRVGRGLEPSKEAGEEEEKEGGGGRGDRGGPESSKAPLERHKPLCLLKNGLVCM